MAQAAPDTLEPLPQTCLPTWDVEDLPEPRKLGWRNLTALIGPGIVMCGIQIGGGEWLFGPDVTAKYGGGLMWIATIAIVCQVFYNIECGRYALYTGEPVFTGFMRTQPGPRFWVGITMLLSIGSLIPGLSTNAAVLMIAILRRHPPGPEDTALINGLSLVLLGMVVLPVLAGGKVYNMLQVLMTTKVVVVLGFCLIIGICFVSRSGWSDVFGGFLEFGNVPVKTADESTAVVNAFGYRRATGMWPAIELANIATLGAFAGYAGGGGLSNSTYSNFVRDKGWGMGSRVGAIASAIGGRNISLSHIGKVFRITPENLRRWKLWWQYILADQLLVWMPGCFMGMALPALMSIEFAKYSPMFGKDIPNSQALIVADGMRHATHLGSLAPVLWLLCLVVGLFVFIPSQISIVDDFARRWTDIIWSSNRRVREGMEQTQVRRIYYFILSMYVLWSFLSALIFLNYGSIDKAGGAAKAMVTVIANLNNVALGFTAFQVLWINLRFLPKVLQPRWWNTVGILACGVFYLSLATLVALNVFGG